MQIVESPHATLEKYVDTNVNINQSMSPRKQHKKNSSFSLPPSDKRFTQRRAPQDITSQPLSPEKNSNPGLNRYMKEFNKMTEMNRDVKANFKQN